MKQKEFRAELEKIMPGYKWTIRKSNDIEIATGIQSSGFNRLSTLEVRRAERDGRIKYEVRSSGFGRRAPWLASAADTTLARALRELQNHYEREASNYYSHASALKNARRPAPLVGEE